MPSFWGGKGTIFFDYSNTFQVFIVKSDQNLFFRKIVTILFLNARNAFRIHRIFANCFSFRI